MLERLPKGYASEVQRQQLPIIAAASGKRDAATLRWGRDRIGLGVLLAMYTGQLIVFLDEASPVQPVASRSGHLVVCEAGEPLSEIIAANYAFSLDAGLHIIEQTDEVERAQLLQAYYSIDAPGVDASAERKHLRNRLRELVGAIDLPKGGSLTFITRQLPFGAAFPERPSTHLFTYPDLGIVVVNGFTAEQKGKRGTNVAVLVDPEKVRAPEIEAAAKLLPERGMFVRGYRGRGASVRAISEMVDLFPYDLLIFATHCGDASGWRWTYDFRDSEGFDRRLVTDIAIGVGQTDDADMLRVLEFIRFHSLDGVDWNDPVAKARLYVGTAMRDWAELKKANSLKPVHKEKIGRVVGSAAMMMWDHNYIAMPRTLAAEGSPIIINNACVSWHELAERFLFSNARAYVGTLFSVSDIEAEEIVVRLLDKYFGKSLPHGLWAAQNVVYGAGGDRRPYVMTGVYPQRLRVTKEDIPGRVLSRLRSGQSYWRRRADVSRGYDGRGNKNFDDIATFYAREVASFEARWFAPKLARNTSGDA
ncbi:hypothetical protein OCOJLMKI_1867 [Methylobacterium iners]|uniref:Uncharacterized protein n=2 Tax=Methylobacterium iners TaxID=418707 RepID=A0ABQ4RY93_9HYPH|nr:hypothetical protein OCOJLMKI_1867 [Methylobacterium iners]